MLEIKFIKAEETFSIRRQVLRKGIDLPFKFLGDDLSSTFHLGAFYNNELIGVATFMKNNNELFKEVNQYQLRGMATLEKARGKGVGKELLAKAKNILEKKQVSIIWCNAREIAVNFYKKQGYEVIGNAFFIDKIGAHYKMFTRI